MVKYQSSNPLERTMIVFKQRKLKLKSRVKLATNRSYRQLQITGSLSQIQLLKDLYPTFFALKMNKYILMAIHKIQNNLGSSLSSLKIAARQIHLILFHVPRLKKLINTLQKHQLNSLSIWDRSKQTCKTSHIPFNRIRLITKLDKDLQNPIMK